MILKLPSCPFCGCKMWYIEAYIFKNKPIYKCKNCKEKSSVQINQFIFKLFWVVEILSILIFCVSLFLGSETAFLGLILTILIFGILYIFSPYSVNLSYLQKINMQNKKISKKYNETGIYTEYRENTENDIYSN